MSLIRMAWRYLWSRPLVTALTVAGISLGVALICGVLTLRRETERTFQQEAALFDLVVGAKGSPLQLVLSSVYHLDMPTGNVPYALYEKLKTNHQVAIAIPIGLGDNYQGYRIVGTEPVLFTLTSVSGDAPFFKLKDGRFFKDNEDFQVVLGAQVAQVTGLKVGDSFVGTHGLVSMPGSEEHKNFPYHVVGILEPTGTAQDRAIFGSLASVWRIHDKEAEIHEAIRGQAPKEPPPRETTAILLRLKARGLRLWMADDIRKNTVGMPAIPVNEILRLYQNVLEPMQQTLLAVAGAVVIVACLTVLTTLYQSAERRRRDVAIIRCLGGRRMEVGLLMLLEATLLGLTGIAVGWLLSHGLLMAGADMIRQKAGLLINAWSIDKLEGEALGLVALCAILAGLVPAISCYRRTPAHDLGVTE
jgi:putative ABC transport system permease protein